jgi:hypothetical protein
VLNLSPDGRFLSDTLWDINSDQIVERRRLAQQTNSALTTDEFPTIGSQDAAVTLVIFLTLNVHIAGALRTLCRLFTDQQEVISELHLSNIPS